MPLGIEIHTHAHTQSKRATLNISNATTFFFLSPPLSLFLSFCSIRTYIVMQFFFWGEISRDGAVVIYVGTHNHKNLHAHLIRSSIFFCFVWWFYRVQSVFNTLEIHVHMPNWTWSQKLHSSHAVTQSEYFMNFANLPTQKKNNSILKDKRFSVYAEFSIGC